MAAALCWEVSCSSAEIPEMRWALLRGGEARGAGRRIGASLFEALMRLKLAAFARARQRSGEEPPTTGHQYGTLRGLAAATSADVAVSSLLLLALIQPHRAPLAFGGWALGRVGMLTSEVELVATFDD